MHAGADGAWNRIGTSSKIGMRRIISAKERSDKKAEMETAISETIELHQSEKNVMLKHTV